MNYIIDLIILLFIALVTFINYKRGLIKVAFGLLSFIMAIVISVVLYKPISNFIINNTTIDDNLTEVISSRLENTNTTKDEKNNIISNYYENYKNASISVLAVGISQSIINVGCVLVVFIVSKLVLLVFRFTGDLIAKLPLIKQCNSLGGFLYGIVISFVLIYVFFAVVSIASPFININNFINLINSSIIANIIYNNNLILILFA